MILHRQFGVLSKGKELRTLSFFPNLFSSFLSYFSFATKFSVSHQTFLEELFSFLRSFSLDKPKTMKSMVEAGTSSCLLIPMFFFLLR